MSGSAGWPQLTRKGRVDVSVRPVNRGRPQITGGSPLRVPSFLRRRPSAALIVACVALFISLGGASYAAVTIPNNSVGAAQLKRTRSPTQARADNCGLAQEDPARRGRHLRANLEPAAARASRRRARPAPRSARSPRPAERSPATRRCRPGCRRPATRPRSARPRRADDDHHAGAAGRAQLPGARQPDRVGDQHGHHASGSRSAAR